MTSVYTNIFTHDEISLLSNLPQVLEAKQKLDESVKGVVYFSIPLSLSMKEKIKEQLHLDLFHLHSIPMRWIRGDTHPHIDNSSQSFTNTYLMYLNDSPGHLLIDGQSYPISEGTTYVFNEGLYHETRNTESVPRLLLGPMSESGLTVGFASPLQYFSSRIAALNTDGTKLIAYKSYSGNPNDYEIGQFTWGTLNGITKWKISPSSVNGTFSTSRIYSNGTYLDDNGIATQYNLYPYVETKPRNQKQALRQSLALSPVWKAYKYYERNALKYGFTRITLVDYKKIYYSRR
jgi:hypothetical protein